MRRLIWLCPPLMLVAATAIFLLMGFTVRMAILGAIILVCPAIIVYGLIKALRRPAELSLEPVSHTRGMLLDWLSPIYDWCCLKFGIGPKFRTTTLRYAGLQPGNRFSMSGAERES